MDIYIARGEERNGPYSENYIMGEIKELATDVS
jgi:hypothetical protein